MTKTHYGLRKGEIYRKLLETTYTYVYCSSIRNYVVSLMNDIRIADVIGPIYNQVISWMSEPLFKNKNPIEIDYNYIEVIFFLFLKAGLK